MMQKYTISCEKCHKTFVHSTKLTTTLAIKTEN